MNATVCQAARCPSASAAAASLAPRPLALGRPANPLRCAGGSGAGLLRSSRPAAGGRGMAVQAALLPAALPLLGQAVGSFVLFYCSLNWATLRRMRKASEEHSQQRSGQDEERKARIQKLTRGKGDSDKKQE